MISKSAQLLIDFARYCEIKRNCLYQSPTEEGKSICSNSSLKRKECRFENCPLMERCET